MRKLFAVIGAAALLLLTPVSASAAPGGVEVSPDGVSYSSDYPGYLFTSISKLVPGDTDQELFYVRNSANEAGVMRITLRDAVTSNSDFGNALTLGVSTFFTPGNSVTLLEASPCIVLLEGQIVQPGEVVRVTTSLALGQLRGNAGQNATASASLDVALSSSAVSLPSTDCGDAGTVVPVAPQQPSINNTHRAPGTFDSGGVIPPIAPPAAPNDPGAETDLPVLNLPQVFGMDPNTWHLWEELFILIPIGASVFGGLVFGIVAKLRRNGDDQLETA